MKSGSSSFRLLNLSSDSISSGWALLYNHSTRDFRILHLANLTKNGHFSLIHVPHAIYTSLLGPIIRILLPTPDTNPLSGPEKPFSPYHEFLNISVTPIEASIVCSVSWADHVFQPFIASLPSNFRDQITISHESYVVFSVGGAGTEAGQRVMDLTAPLAMAGIPIFFITTYYTDFILVPTTHRSSVIQALLSQGYEFSAPDQAYVAPTSLSHSRGLSDSLTQRIVNNPPSTPPPSSIAELQMRTFAHLKKRKVVPFIADGLHLVQCSGKRRDDEWCDRPASNGTSNGNGWDHGQQMSSWLNTIDPKLYTGLIVALANTPRFLSITLTSEDAPSLLIDKNLLPMFGDSITGDAEGDLVPIFLDLAGLPEGSTGIVCGVAGKLVNGLSLGGDVGIASELSYLSTARAGAVILSGESAARGLEVLRPLLED